MKKPPPPPSLSQQTHTPSSARESGVTGFPRFYANSTCRPKMPQDHTARPRALPFLPSCADPVPCAYSQSPLELKYAQAGVECTKEYLEGTEGRQEVISEYKHGIHDYGISGVPYFIVSREGSKATVPLSGGQPPAAFVEAFEALSS